MSEVDFLELIEAGHESRNIEFKSPFSWTDDNSVWLREKVIKTILGLANTPDGGYVIVGIEEDEHRRPVFSGLDEDQINSFSYDGVKGNVDGFSSTNPNFDISLATYQNKKFIVLKVEEFDDIPIICKNNSRTEQLLKKGVVYCRSRSGPPQTVPVTETEMREIIQKAVDKQQELLKRRGYKYIESGKLTEDLFKLQRDAFEE